VTVNSLPGTYRIESRRFGPVVRKRLYKYDVQIAETWGLTKDLTVITDLAWDDVADSVAQHAPCPIAVLLGEAREQVAEIRAGIGCRTLDPEQTYRALEFVLDGPLSVDAIYDASHPAVTS
jgi:hypothetical protein